MSHLMSNEVLGIVAANIGIKDLIHTAVCVFLILTVVHHAFSALILLVGQHEEQLARKN